MAEVKTINEYIEDAENITAPLRNNAIESVDKITQSQIDQINNTYAASVANAKTAYESEYQRNAVQKAINEKVIAEKNANLGLTDSGLNRTQQTASQLSYSNQKASIDLQRQKALDTLESNLAASIATINQTGESQKMTINQTYDQLNLQTATDLRNADISQKQFDDTLAEEQRQFDETMNLQKSEFEVSTSQAVQADTESQEEDYNLMSYGGIDESTGKSVFYDKNGKKRLVERGVNPYTGTINPDAKNGTFNNGYQPNNIGGIKLVNSGESPYILHGKEVTVWKMQGDDSGKLWVWDGPANKYRTLEEV